MNKTHIRKSCLAVAGALVFGFAGNAMAETTEDIINALVSKGVLTEEEGDLLAKGRKTEKAATEEKSRKAWYNHINIRGYVQNRHTTMMGGDEGVNLWTDRSVGSDKSLGSDAPNNFLIRRARIIFSGQIGDHLGFYIQPDFASSAGTTGNIAQLRDAYGDIFIDKDQVHRFRVGQSKVPYGFENLQSSSNRLALDRVDAMNSAVRDERDTGVFYYYTPKDVQALFNEINKLGLKHSGNYGMFALGAHQGQGANRAEKNDTYHWVSRFTYPWKTESGQIFEAGIQAYKGKFVSSTGSYNRYGGTFSGSTCTSSGSSQRCWTPTLENSRGIEDERVGVSFMMYPQPWGLEAEWNWGNTPGLDMESNTIEKKSLNGGYIQTMYKKDNVNFLGYDIGTLIPFVKWQYFDGYNKAETNSPRNQVNDWEFGTEWQIAPEVELVAVYHRMHRNNLVTGATSGRQDYERFEAQALRVQLQYNFF